MGEGGGRLLDKGRLLERASNINYTPQGGRLLDTGRLFESGRLLDHLRYTDFLGERLPQSHSKTIIAVELAYPKA